MTDRAPIPPRLIRELTRRLNPGENERQAWSQVYSDYHGETQWQSAAAHLDAYLAWTERQGNRPTPSGYRQWIINGERMSTERYLREVTDKREAIQAQEALTPEQQRLAQWRKDWCE